MKEAIKEVAKTLGFDLIGFSECKEVEEEFKEFYLNWIKNNYNGELKYLEKNLEKKFNPKEILPSGQTVISLGINYYSKIPHSCLFPRYLTKIDYHKFIKNLLKEFVKKLKNLIGNFEYRFFVDTGPVLEKYWARKSGIGFMGKNSLIINPDFGSFIFLSEIIIDKEIEPDKEIENLCKNCKKCINSCPTEAIVSNGIIDVRKCISYLTIEKNKISEAEKNLIKKGNKIFGCEICQEVCQFNQNLKETEKENLKISEFLKNLKLEEFKKLSSYELKRIFVGTTFERKLKFFDKNFFL
ncbi:MAG: tRNA epoxyqueuosine(34) reductase QueG [Candidatus Omnitrophica bacterium]|nr:tRNA epoxyqueuosine(34) reductase QueG [Candidatus Omnitrophota bacterium]